MKLARHTQSHHLEHRQSKGMITPVQKCRRWLCLQLLSHDSSGCNHKSMWVAVMAHLNYELVIAMQLLYVPLIARMATDLPL